VRLPLPSALRALRGRSGPDLDAELRWWLEEWDAIVRGGGGYFPGDVLEILGEEPEASYLARRWQIARAEVARVLERAEIDDPSYFSEKFVVDVGPGPLGFPNACPAAACVGIEPLADAYREHGLLLQDGAVYLCSPAERTPLVGNCADVVLAKNSLDHVTDPRAVVAEIRRLLKPGGELLLDVDVDHPASATEPHSFTQAQVRSLLEEGFEVASERLGDAGHGGGSGRALFIRARPRERAR
jgi:SAM-dependent methyltransferase